MAPIRRYLRITKYSVLECRIYAEYPSASEAWLLGSNNPALPRIIKAIRPNVLPKLREENERARTGKSKKKTVADSIIEDDFEVSYYFLDTSTRHSILTKSKTFSDKPRLASTSNKLTGWLNAGQADKPLVIPDEDGDILIAQEDRDKPINLEDIPELPNEQINGDDTLFVHDSEDSDPAFEPGPRRSRKPTAKPLEAISEDNKKLGLRTYYDGFSIYGRILCLVVRRRGGPINAAAANSQQIMENWISTQAVGDGLVLDD